MMMIYLKKKSYLIADSSLEANEERISFNTRRQTLFGDYD